MSDQLTDTLPQESDEQRIGRLASKAFIANAPDSWKLDPTDGDNDCGYDFQVQRVEGALVKDIFRAQLKGQTSPKLNAAGTKYSVSLDMSTVNYYARALEPTLLVLCDASSAPESKNWNLYYCWIHEEIRRIREQGVEPNQKSVTFHVPTSNRLYESTDLSGDIEQFRLLARIGNQISIIVEKENPELSAQERVAQTTKIVPNLESRSPALLESLIDDSSTSWVEAPKGSLQWDLQEAKTALRSGNARRCQTLLDHAHSLFENARLLEKADYWHVLGRLRMFEFNEADANIAFDQACSMSNNADVHVVPWAETALRLKLLDSDGLMDLQEIMNRLTSSSPSVVGMKARLMAAEGKYDDALTISEGIDGIEKHIAKSIIFSMQGKWNEAIYSCEEGLAESTLLKESLELLFVILRAKARYSLAVGLTMVPEPKMEIVLPSNGPVGTNVDILRSVWEDISKAIMMLRSSGWPINLELISDIWAHTAIMLGLQKEALPLLEEASEARPSLAALQMSVEMVAAQTGNLSLALKANSRQPESDRSILRRITLLHFAHRDGDCVDLMCSKGEEIASDASMLGNAMSFAIFSAERLVRTELVLKWTQMMESNQELAPSLAMHRYASAISNQVLAKDTALDALEAQYEKLGYPSAIAKLLFHELNPARQEHATKLLDLVEVLAKERLLGPDEYLILAQTLTTLHQWDKLLALSDQALTRFDNSDRLIALGALALDKLGRAAEAHSRLLTLIKKENPDPFALNTYINIATISGFTSEAIEALESVLANETDKRGKIQCLSHLFRMVHISDPSSPRLIEIAWRIGQTVNQESEVEEGLFLTSMFSATLPAESALSDERKMEFQRRISAFTTRFPNSKTLMSLHIPETTSAEGFLRILTDALGIDEDHLRWRAKIQNQLSRGLTPVPYAWRPRLILDGISDLPTLWEIAKTSRWEHQQFHLTMVLAEWVPVSLVNMSRRIPLLDFTALLVIHDLGLFDKLFEVFPKIAIGKATLLELQRLLSPMSGSPYRAKCENLLSALKTKFERIEQPSMDSPEDDKFAKSRWASQEVIEIAKMNPRFMIYSDDALFRVFAAEGTSDSLSICTLDVLKAMDGLGILSAKTVAKYIARLCSWRVGLVIPLRYQLAVLPDELGGARSAMDGIDILRSDEFCNALYSSIWHAGRPFADLQGHIGTLLRDLAEDSANTIDSVTALAGLWVSKVKLYRQSPTPVTRLITLAIGQAMFIDRPMSQVISQRLWSIFRKLIEINHEPFMDERVYGESIEAIAWIAAELDQVYALTGDRAIAERLRMGLTDGTSDYEKFVGSLSIAMISLAKPKDKQPN